MHHVHISTEFLFVLAILTIGLAWVIGWAVTTTRRDRREAERVWLAPTYDTARRSTPPAGFASGGYVQPAPTVVHNSGGGSSDLLTGVLIGNMLGSHHDTTVVHDVAPSYVDNYSSSSSDSGFSYSDSGSSSSSDSSSGFDASY